MRSRTLLLGALLATAALLAACSTGPGPLVDRGFGGGGGHECISFALGQPVTDGMYVLDNTGTSPVTVTGVNLTSVHGLAMTKAWLVPPYKPPHGALTYVGVQLYPPVTFHTWTNRQPIPGSVIKPGQGLNLLFGLTRTGPKDGHTNGPAVTYTASGNTYTLQEHFGFIIVAPHSHCPR
ncbi:MAG TPA: hypothetical protein VLM11_18205 [Streptosporangiaceae bacterium]|nr:hypothetical protein [Streptosporangiaceae bacterium]